MPTRGKDRDFSPRLELGRYREAQQVTKLGDGALQGRRWLSRNQIYAVNDLRETAWLVRISERSCLVKHLSVSVRYKLCYLVVLEVARLSSHYQRMDGKNCS